VVGEKDALEVVARDDLAEEFLSDGTVAGGGVGRGVLEGGCDLVEAGDRAGDGESG
jgi:hypothetical protein